ncbi:glycosyltransferase [Chroococcidiopsis sp. CCMEE 29]|uniref:glycosyltransferase n=1 Tax=Chroococcidiopsis sp. CCMEE 29 TaxID=155894 RepID=UPI00202006E0|nr:glycosyltransferase [Chroococcidiopsis sp. CCMEE 29]
MGNGSEAEQLRTQLRTNQLELEQLKSQLQATQAEVARSQGTIAAMETSKFWQARLKWFKVKQKFQQLLQKNSPPAAPTSIVTPPLDYPLPHLSLPRHIPQRPKVLLIVEESIPQCFRYRVQQKLEQLQVLEYEANWISWRDHITTRTLLHFCHIVIFYRVPAFAEVIHTIKYAKALKKLIFFDIDDLIFNGDAYPPPLESLSGQISVEEYNGLVQGVALYREALSLCDYAIASTPTLVKEMEQVTGKGTSFCHRNAIDNAILQFVHSGFPKLQRDYLSIFYGSGTKTHDADFQVVASALARLMEKHPYVRLTIIGYLSLPDSLTPYIDRIDRVGLLSNVNVYWEFLSQADINIAPLKQELFNDCKSEIKWMEAAVLGVPSVVSGTQMYVEVLQDGVDAMIAYTPEEWFDKLNLLVSNTELRCAIAQGAQEKARRDYNPLVMANNLKNILHSGMQKAASAGQIVLSEPKKKLLFVNVLYPPQALGGATGLVKNIVDTLIAKYGDRYEISIFTYDLENPKAYELFEYTHDGVHVTRLSLPPWPDIDWRYQDQRVYDLFSQYLTFNQPDLIHFHCVQRLTTSTLEAAINLNIPYIVTLHDAWWICDHQFMLDKNGVERDYHQNDPLVVARYADDINSSILRRRYLAKCLNHAKVLLAVSEFQAELYCLNGFTQVQVNRNGILPQPVLPRTPAANRIRLGYAGGICVHKGYYFLKEAILAADLRNSELTVIDLFVAPGSATRHETWGSTPVNFIPKLPPENMPEFYSQIDVLIAPSLWPESFGLISREAILAGVWVVASNKGGLAEDIRPGVDGDVFSPHHINELVAILKKLEREPESYQQQVAEAKYIRRIDEQVSELESIYDTILNQQKVFA